MSYKGQSVSTPSISQILIWCIEVLLGYISDLNAHTCIIKWVSS